MTASTVLHRKVRSRARKSHGSPQTEVAAPAAAARAPAGHSPTGSKTQGRHSPNGPKRRSDAQGLQSLAAVHLPHATAQPRPSSLGLPTPPLAVSAWSTSRSPSCSAAASAALSKDWAATLAPSTTAAAGAGCEGGTVSRAPLPR